MILVATAILRGTAMSPSADLRFRRRPAVQTDDSMPHGDAVGEGLDGGKP